jgi:hypothetical protein
MQTIDSILIPARLISAIGFVTFCAIFHGGGCTRTVDPRAPARAGAPAPSASATPATGSAPAPVAARAPAARPSTAALPEILLPVAPPPPVVVTAAPATPAEPAFSPTGEGTVSLRPGAIGTGVYGRAPIGVASTFHPSTGQLLAWIKVQNTGKPQPLFMVWRKAGKEAVRLELEVGTGKGWRTWSRKRIGPKDVGHWSVEVVTASGTHLGELAFEVDAAAPGPVGAVGH